MEMNLAADVEQALSGFIRIHPTRYHDPALAELHALIDAEGYEERIIPVSATLAATVGLQEARVSVLVKSYVCGFTSFSTQAAGYSVQVIDLGTRYEYFAYEIKHQNISGQGTTPEGITFPLHLLPKPRLVLEPGLLSIRLQNLAALSNPVQFCLWVIEPPCRD